jgi:hypothetical protein
MHGSGSDIPTPHNTAHKFASHLTCASAILASQGTALQIGQTRQRHNPGHASCRYMITPTPQNMSVTFLWLAVAREKILASHTIKTLQALHAVSVWTVDRGRCGESSQSRSHRDSLDPMGVSDMCGAFAQWVSGRLRVAIVGGARCVRGLASRQGAKTGRDGRDTLCDECVEGGNSCSMLRCCE